MSFQEETHATEIDDGVTAIQGVHAENATDSRAALTQGEMRQRSHAEFRGLHFEISDFQVVDSRSADSACRSGGKLRR